jgi:hypothetical protein
MILEPIQPLASKPRLRRAMLSGEQSSRAAISMSCIPSAAYNIILARCTVPNGS